MKKLLIIAFYLPCYFGFAQKVPEPINSVEIYKAAMKLYEEKKYQGALAEFEKVDRNDTNYYAVLVQKAVTFLELEEYDEAVAACREGIELNSTETHNFYINLGVALNNAKRTAEALEILNEGIEKFPKNHLLYYNKGVVYNGMGKIRESVEMYKQTILLNPYYPNSHLNLAVYAADEGKISQAMMSFNMYLILEPTGSNSSAVLQRLNEIVSSKYEKKPAGILLSPEGSDDFSESDLLVSNYAALSESFKVPVKSELPLVKQNYALFSKMTYEKNDKGFWMQTYVPFFKEVVKKEWFDDFTYYILQASGNEVHVKLVNKKAEEIRQFASWATAELDKINSVRPVDVDGKTQNLKHWYDSKTHGIKAIVNSNADNTKLLGYCENYYRNGRMASKGYYDNSGNKTGLWTFYYQNGAVFEEVTYENGKLQGAFKTFYDNGSLKREGSFSAGVQSGGQKDYNYAELLSSSAFLKDDLLNGEFTLYYDLGGDYKNYEGNYLGGKINDSLVEYYDNGAVASRKKITGDVANGDIISYYRDGKIAVKETQVNGIKDGEYKSYYPGGRLKQEGLYKDGTEIGLWKSYYKDGSVEEETQYDEKGKKNGISKNYDYDGKLFFEMEYSKGELIAYKYYDKDGKIIKEDRKKKGEFDFIGFYPGGKKKLEGIYTVKGKKGLWKYYDEHENLTAEENYDDKGQIHGKILNYYPMKKIKSEINYKEGERDGYYVSYFKNGQSEQEGWFKSGRMEGYWINYLPDGTLESKLYYSNGKMHGYQQYFDVTGKLEREEYYKDDINEKDVYYDSTGKVSQTIFLKAGTGDYIYYYNNKQPSFHGKYISGIAHGDFTWYYYDGKISTKGAYYNGRLNGKWTWYSPDGKIEKEGEYYYGVKQGKWMYYYPGGKLKRIENYEEDELNGETVYYFENGGIDVKKIYRNNEEEGACHYYDPSGELKHTRNFVNGRMVSYSYNGADGKLIPPVNIESGTYKFTAYYKNGNKSKEYEIVNGSYHGKFIEYYPDGKTQEIIHYKNNMNDGDEISFYPDGKTEYEKKHSDNYLNGPAKEYYPDGGIKKSAFYKMDKMHGLCTYYEKGGKKIKEETYYSGRVVKSVTF